MKEFIEVSLKEQNGIYLVYELIHLKDGFKNVYNINAKICGADDCKENALYITVYNCENLTNNEGTLMDEFAIELLENYLAN